MHKLWLSVPALVLGLALTGSASAATAHLDHGHRPVTAGSSYYRDHGVRFGGGYYYHGNEHPHWDHRYWDATHGRYLYFDLGLHCYYYWNPAQSCYYPVGY